MKINRREYRRIIVSSVLDLIEIILVLMALVLFAGASSFSRQWLVFHMILGLSSLILALIISAVRE